MERLKGGLAERAPWQTLREIFDTLLNGLLFLSYPIPAEYLLFRGRICNDVELFCNVRELTCRPIEIVKDYGRCHRPGFSVFYGANNLDTVLSELAPNAGDKVHVAVAHTSATHPVYTPAIGEIEHVRRYGRALIGNSDAQRSIQQFLDDISSEHDLRILVLDAFLAELFYIAARREREYRVTSALSDVIFSYNRPDQQVILDGFAYPSVGHRGGLNFAFPAPNFTAKMQKTRCMAFEITDYLGFGIYGRNQYAKSETIDESGNIEWIEL
jgi:hypothetical protein